MFGVGVAALSAAVAAAAAVPPAVASGVSGRRGARIKWTFDRIPFYCRRI